MNKITAKERDDLINSWADKSYPQAKQCPIHKCLFRGKCPECFKEESLKKHGEEIVKRGMFGKENKNKQEQIRNREKIKEELKVKQEKADKANIKLKLKKMKEDKEYRARQCLLHKKAWAREKVRKLEHSL
jgi:hypothetical protein